MSLIQPGGTIVVVAGDGDVDAHELPGRLPGLDVRLLTPTDLSRLGWEFRPGRPGGMAVVSGEPVPVDFAAVLVRLPWVAEHDLPHIDSRDRQYVAAEMTAFLLAWLSALPCPVINRPSATCLAGPLWRPERWVRLAGGLGLPVRAVRRRAGDNHTPQLRPRDAGETVVTVIGDRCLGACDATPTMLLQRLARLAGAAVLTVQLSGPADGARFVTASPWPNITDDAVLAAVLEAAGVSAPAQVMSLR